ncbi:MAG: RidA family protein [Acidobacteria bacterium]|nr:MAG: RidA family protein [Acidobacteriota bacterium]
MTPLTTVSSDAAPKALGPYSQAIAAGGLLFTAGQVPLDPATMKLVEGEIAAQTERVLENLSAVLSAAGCTLDDVVKTTVFLTDMGDFAEMNRVYAERFGAHRPARSTVQVGRLPAGARVEIELVARLRT